MCMRVKERERQRERSLRRDQWERGQERVTEMIYLSVIEKAREIARWIRVLAIQALGPKFKSPGPTYKPSHGDTSAYNPRSAGAERRGMLSLLRLEDSNAFTCFW